MATSIAGLPHPGHFFYICDHNSNTRFLVDTGAEVSIIPPTREEQLHPQCAFSLQGFDGSHITTYGVRSCTLNIGLRCTFSSGFRHSQRQASYSGYRLFSFVVDMWCWTPLDSTTHLRVDG